MRHKGNACARKGMDYSAFGDLAWKIIAMDIIAEDKLALLVGAMSRLVGQEYDTMGILSQLEELDRESFGKICAFCVSKDKLFTDTFHSPSRIKPISIEVDDGDDMVEEYVRGKKRKLSESTFVGQAPRTGDLNAPLSFHEGRPCALCNKLAHFFNQRNEKISMPSQHPYGECPAYCTVCHNSFACESPMEHLIHSCERCNATYCNHPTEKCNRAT